MVTYFVMDVAAAPAITCDDTEELKDKLKSTYTQMKTRYDDPYKRTMRKVECVYEEEARRLFGHLYQDEPEDDGRHLQQRNLKVWLRVTGDAVGKVERDPFFTN